MPGLQPRNSFENINLQPHASFDETGRDTPTGRQNEIHTVIAGFEQQLVDEKAAMERMIEAGNKAGAEDAEKYISEIEQSLEHFREEEAELIKANTDTEDDIAA